MWETLLEKAASVGAELSATEGGASDHLLIQRAAARVLLVTPQFLLRNLHEQGLVRGEPAAGLLLVGEPPESLDVNDLAALGVEGRWSTAREVPASQVDLALARAARAGQDRTRFEIGHVLDIASTLNAEQDPDRLLGRILESMRGLTCADAGTLYVVDRPDSADRRLRFRVAQNDSLELGDLPAGTLPVDKTSIAGYVVTTRQPLNLADVQRLPPGPYRFNASFDRRANYRTVSMLTVPLLAADGRIIGAVQLINRKLDPAARLGEPGGVPEQVTPFSDREVELAMKLAGAAAIALTNARLSAEIRALFEGFVHASVMAIDARDPCTSGHSQRVCRLTVGLADAAQHVERFEELAGFSEERRRRLKYAALLHDFGKIGVAEEVLVKAKKLFPAELIALQHRFEIIGLSHEVRMLRAALSGELASGEAEQVIARIRRELHDNLGHLVLANEPAPLSADIRERVSRLSTQSWTDANGNEHAYLTPREKECLAVPYGSLTDDEREAIQQHVVHTQRFLEQIPWGRFLQGLPEIAGLHHEKLDGSGYPYGYSGDQIPLESRIITVCDIYDALAASDRPYKAALPHVAACDILFSEADRGRLDPALVEVFVEHNVHDGARE